MASGSSRFVHISSVQEIVEGQEKLTDMTGEVPEMLLLRSH